MSRSELRLIQAITRAIAEHGAPNTFSFGELETYYCGPPAMVAGRIASNQWPTRIGECRVTVQDRRVCVEPIGGAA